jgi:hypothetical protein
VKVTHSTQERQFPAETEPPGRGARHDTDHPHSLPLTRTLLNALQRQQLQTPEQLRSMNAQTERAALELADAGPDAVASACLVAIMAQGPVRAAAGRS